MGVPIFVLTRDSNFRFESLHIKKSGHIMASVWKHPQSKYWVACFTDHEGKRRKKSTKSTNKREAQKMADLLEDGYRRKKTETQIRSAVNELFEDLHESRFQASTVKEFCEMFVQSKKAEASPATIIKYNDVVKAFAEQIGEERYNSPLHVISWKDIQRYRDTIAEEGKAPGTINSKLKCLKAIFAHAYKVGELNADPGINVSTVKNKKTGNGRRPFTIAELKKVYDYADEEWRGMILMGLYTGQRLGDIARLKWSQINLESRQIVFRTGKTDKVVILPISEPVKVYLHEVSNPSPDSPVFPRAFAVVDKVGVTVRLSQQFIKLLADVGLAEKRTHQSKGVGRNTPRKQNELSFHSLRHTTTSMLKQAGASQGVAMGIIGHDSKAISDQYTHIDLDTMDRYIKKLPSLN